MAQPPQHGNGINWSDKLADWYKPWVNISAISFIMLLLFFMYRDFSASAHHREEVMREELAQMRANSANIADKIADRMDRVVEVNLKLIFALQEAAKATREAKDKKGGGG